MRITRIYWLRPNALAVYVCVCNAVTDREIRQCADLGVATLDQLRECLGVASCCGKCEGTARALLGESGTCAERAAPGR
jgi:bacterioferritin-associated ferredoxin